MQTFCTIISPDFLPFAKNLFNSLVRFNPDLILHVLVVDKGVQMEKEEMPGGIRIHSTGDLEESPVVRQLRDKFGSTSDQFRWAMKPIFISYLLQNHHKVIYTDCDIYFYSDPGFLFDELDNHSLLLSPHWAEPDAIKNEEEFLVSLRVGLFNAGFIGATQQGLPSLKWWADICGYVITKDYEKGFFDDQRYLDLFVITDPGSRILRHQGCNLGSWNIHTCKRSQRNGEVMINDKFPVVFVHYTKDTVTNILNRNDQLLRPYFDEYAAGLKKLGVDTNRIWNDNYPEKFESIFYKTKHRLRLRTRLKRYLFKLASKL